MRLVLSDPEAWALRGSSCKNPYGGALLAFLMASSATFGVSDSG